MKYLSNNPTNVFFLLIMTLILADANAQGFEGYYRYADIHDEQIVFSAEGDLWTVPLSGGLAHRLTTHPEEERYASFSPDGSRIAFSASYEGPTEVYTIPSEGGLPERWTFESDFSMVNGWTPDGKIVYDTRAFSTLPNRQLVTIDLESNEKSRLPLSEASEGAYDPSGAVYFVNPAYHGNVTKRYKGGTARQIWKFAPGDAEAQKLTTDYPGGSHHPMWFNNRIYFITDRDGTMNIWSMKDSGGDLQQHTEHQKWDVRYAKIHKGHIVYQLGADLWHYNVESDVQKKIDIRLVSDLDQLREKWDDNPSQYITAAHPDPSGERIVVTARGRVFVIPVNGGRTVEFVEPRDTRYRDATFSSDGERIIALSDESGELEYLSLPANGIGDRSIITKDGKVLRYQGKPSPDGKWLAYDDLENHMFILNIETGVSRLISTNEQGITSFNWSPDSRWISFGQRADNTMEQILIYNLEEDTSFPLTTDRANSSAACWSPDGKFIYFISDRSFTTLVRSPWGPRQPEPYFDASEKLYHVALEKGSRSPFRPGDELFDEKNKSKEQDDSIQVKIDREGITKRIIEVPIPAGNYRGLEVSDKAIYLMTGETGLNAKAHLGVVKIATEDVKLERFVDDVRSFEMTSDKNKILIRKRNDFYMVPAGTSKIGKLSAHKIDFKNLKIAITPREDWKQIFTDAWRLERDYFYDKNMHGVNWQAMHDKYYPLTDRITSRSELSDLIGRFVGELSALHTSVRGGDMRSDATNIAAANLGARLVRDESQGGFLIEYIYKADPDYPDEKSPLDDPYLDIREGDVITSVNGKSTLITKDIHELLRNQVGQQVRLTIERAGKGRDVIVKPIGSMYGLRYRDWEYKKRLEVEAKTKEEVGYVHLRAMGSNDLNQWYREFYPVFDRPGLIIDVRHNRGGNIESFILEKLLRKAWMYWKARSGKPYWNMQYAFRGHIVVLVDENTASDGEAFADGFRRLELGTTIGTRTWGGEIWLSSRNRLSDNGLARAPMMGVYGPEGEWLIEGHGFVPDIEVKNLPHTTFNGEDAQLDTAIDFLLSKIKEDPREVPPVPDYPDKSFDNKE